MQYLNRMAITYFCGTFILSALLCLMLINSIAWPVMAELPIAISIFIYLMTASKVVFHYMERNVIQQQALKLESH